MPTVEENEQKFEEWGLARVHLLLTNAGLPQFMISDATNWVARREEEKRQRGLAFENEQRQLAREQKESALRSEQIALSTQRMTRNTLLPAWIAAGGAIAALIVGILAWLFPRGS